MTCVNLFWASNTIHISKLYISQNISQQYLCKMVTETHCHFMNLHLHINKSEITYYTVKLVYMKIVWNKNYKVFSGFQNQNVDISETSKVYKN